MINTITERVAFDFFVDREGATVFVVMEFHARSIETGFTLNKITNSGVLDNHFGPKGISRETEEI